MSGTDKSMTYENMRDEFYSYVEANGKMPSYRIMRKVFPKQSSDDFSEYMIKCREEYESFQKSKWKTNLAPIEGVVTHTIETVVGMATKDLTEQLQASRDDNKALNVELCEAITERNDAREERDNALKNATAFEKERDDAHRELSICRNDLSLTRGENDRLHEKVGAYKTKFEAAEEENRVLKAQAEADEEAKKEMTEELDRLRSRLRFLE